MNYWRTRELLERKSLLDRSIDETELMIAREYRRLQENLIKDIQLLYEKIMNEDEPLASHLYKYNEYWELLNKVNNKLTAMGVREHYILEDKFEALYKTNYKKVLPNKSFRFREERIKEVINAVWVKDGKNWSHRIWGNNAKLATKIEEVLVDGVARGISPDKLTEELMNTFSVSYNNARTLVRTEMSHIWNQSALDKYRDAGITHYKVLSQIDCCDICDSLDGKVFPVDTLVIPSETHPNCRCTVLAIIDGNNAI